MKNKFLVIVFVSFFTFLGACRHKEIFNTKISCPDGVRILVKYAKADEVRQAIEKADSDKKKYGTSEQYTVIKLPGQRSFKIEKIPPERMINCLLSQIPIDKNDKDYIYYVN
jgi:hypothetical protein